ncbi:MAG: AMP-binding protein [Acidimicrobiia bacterium]|nr:AMP-binding protein [Acidimicrobiia bacterium]
MTGPNDSQLHAIALPGPAAADAVRRVWDAGYSVAVLDPNPATLRDRLAALAPTHVVDRDGTRPYPAGRGVAAEVGAVVATSGTTGAPRFVQLTTAGLRASAAAVHDAIGLEPSDRWLACLPLHAVAGLAIVARGHFDGVPVETHARFDRDAVLEAAGRCSLVSFVPTTLTRVLDADPLGVARFRRVLLGGGPIPAAVLARAAAAGIAVSTTYGLTETGGGCVHDGHPLAGAEIVLDPETAEILVRGPMVMAGYRDPEATSAGIGPDGWLRTGDIGRWAADGRLEVIDRIKDLIISGGVNVSPVRIEAALRDSAGIADLVVVGLADPEWGERVTAFVVPADPATPPTLGALRTAGAAAGLTPAELPRDVRTIEEVPRTPGGKPLRRVLRDRTA